MVGNQSKQLTINQYILRTVREMNPETVEELVELVQLEYPVPQKKIMERILHLQNQGKIVFEEPSVIFSVTLKDYILSTKALWYWTILALALVTTIAVFTIPKNAHPIVYARWLLGSIFVLLLPGYSLIKALFPTKELDNIERAALSIGMSLALVPITVLLLNYTPWGVRTTPVTLSLLALTIILATLALLREHQVKTKNP